MFLSQTGIFWFLNIFCRMLSVWIFLVVIVCFNFIYGCYLNLACVEVVALQVITSKLLEMVLFRIWEDHFKFYNVVLYEFLKDM